MIIYNPAREQFGRQHRIAQQRTFPITAEPYEHLTLPAASRTRSPSMDSRSSAPGLPCGRLTCGRLQAAGSEVRIGAGDIGGTVASSRGPEAGVWVIAETQDFQTRFAKIVVTDEVGRYLIPDLPQAKYRLWVRGYGLADSPKSMRAPGHAVDLTAVIAPDAGTAAKVYPAAYWYAMMKIPG